MGRKQLYFGDTLVEDKGPVSNSNPGAQSGRDAWGRQRWYGADPEDWLLLPRAQHVVAERTSLRHI